MSQYFKMLNKYKLFMRIVIFILLLGFYFLNYNLVRAASSNIDTIERWAWNDVIGWLDFQYVENPNVVVTSSDIRGYASSSIGYISLNCAYGPPGSDCISQSYNVVNTNGTLSGWGWSDQIGWVSFNCNNTGIGDTCATANYKVTITNGIFSGWAWNDIIGWINFNSDNCDTNSNGFWDVACGGDDATTPVVPPGGFGVQTTWGSGPTSGNLTSNIFDTNDADGTAINTIMWQGTLNNGDVKFQIASSNSSSGPWDFIGPDGTGSTYYGSGAGPNIQIEIDLSDHNNKRYFRYKIFLDSNAGGTQSPQVEDVIINYSP